MIAGFDAIDEVILQQVPVEKAQVGWQHDTVVIDVFTGLGDVTLVVPANFSMELLVELGVTNNTNKSYSVRSDFDIGVETDADWDYSHGTPRKFTRGSGNLNGGDHRVHIRTTNGNVVIRKVQ